MVKLDHAQFTSYSTLKFEQSALDRKRFTRGGRWYSVPMPETVAQGHEFESNYQ
jgi:hypothetical protein